MKSAALRTSCSTNSQWLWILKLAENFQRRKLLWISKFCDYLQKFSPQNLVFWSHQRAFCDSFPPTHISFLLRKFLTISKSHSVFPSSRVCTLLANKNHWSTSGNTYPRDWQCDVQFSSIVANSVLTPFSWHTSFGFPCCAGTVPVPIHCIYYLLPVCTQEGQWPKYVMNVKVKECGGQNLTAFYSLLLHHWTSSYYFMLNHVTSCSSMWLHAHPCDFMHDLW